MTVGERTTHLRFNVFHSTCIYIQYPYIQYGHDRMDTEPTVNVYIQYISITVLILHVSVINKRAIIEKIGSLLGPLHCCLLFLHLEQILQEICKIKKILPTQMESKLSDFMRFSEEHSLPACFSSTVKKKRKQHLRSSFLLG